VLGSAVVDASTVAELRTARSILRVACLLGAIEGAVNHAAAYAKERTQFGRPIIAFQAVAHQVARMEAEAALVAVALDQAISERGRGSGGARARVAEVVAAEAAPFVARAAHQVLGAMGTTEEHQLHRVTKRLWAWQDAPRHVSVTAAELGDAALASGPDGVWRWLTSQSDDLAATAPTREGKNS
jgi:acyl-CoA dehydrogenase